MSAQTINNIAKHLHEMPGRRFEVGLLHVKETIRLLGEAMRQMDKEEREAVMGAIIAGNARLSFGVGIAGKKQ